MSLIIHFKQKVYYIIGIVLSWHFKWKISWHAALTWHLTLNFFRCKNAQFVTYWFYDFTHNNIKNIILRFFCYLRAYYSFIVLYIYNNIITHFFCVCVHAYRLWNIRIWIHIWIPLSLSNPFQGPFYEADPDPPKLNGSELIRIRNTGWNKNTHKLLFDQTYLETLHDMSCLVVFNSFCIFLLLLFPLVTHVN